MGFMTKSDAAYMLPLEDCDLMPQSVMERVRDQPSTAKYAVLRVLGAPSCVQDLIPGQKFDVIG